MLPRPHDISLDNNPARVPEVATRPHEMMDILTLKPNVDSMRYFLQKDFDLVTLRQHRPLLQKLQKEWDERWSALSQKWEVASEAADEEQTRLRNQPSEPGAILRTARQIPGGFALLFVGIEALEYDTPELRAMIPETSDEEKRELSRFLVELNDAVTAIEQEFALVYAGSVLYTTELAPAGFALDDEAYLREWLGLDAVQRYLQSEPSTPLLPTEVAQAAAKKAVTQPVEAMPDLPSSLKRVSGKTQKSLHGYLMFRLFGLKEARSQEAAFKALDGNGADFGQINSEVRTTPLGFKLHVRGNFEGGQKPYEVLKIVAKYCAEHKLCAKVRGYDHDAKNRFSRWPGTFITLYAPDKDLNDFDGNMQTLFEQQLQEVMALAHVINDLLIPCTNKLVVADRSDLELPMGENDAHRLSLRFGTNTDTEEKIRPWLQAVDPSWEDVREKRFWENLPKAPWLKPLIEKNIQA
jgi:hypothetical protein